MINTIYHSALFFKFIFPDIYHDHLCHCTAYNIVFKGGLNLPPPETAWP